MRPHAGFAGRPPRRPRHGTKPPSAVLAAIGVGCLLLAACGSDGPGTDTATGGRGDADAGGGPAWAETVAAAEEEGSVVLYLSITGVDDRLNEAWEAAYPGISLEIFRTGSAELLARLDQEKSTDAAGADVTIHADEGWFLDNGERLSDVTGPAYEEYWGDSKFAYADGDYILVDGAPLGVAYNTNVIEEIGVDPIEEYADLLQPELEGYIGFTPSENASATLQWWYTVSESIGGAGIEELAALDPQPYASLTPLVEALAAGEHAVGVYASLSVVYGLQAQGAPLEVVVPTPAIGGGHFVATVDWASHPNAAEVFRNWILSPEGQVALNGPGDLYTPLSVADIPDAPDTMQSIPEDMFVTNGIVTAEQQAWMDEVWTPAFGG